MNVKQIAALAAALDIFNVAALATGIADGMEQGFELSMGMTYEDADDQWAYDCGTWLGASMAVRPPISRRPFALTEKGFMAEGRIVFSRDQAAHLTGGCNVEAAINDRFSQMLLNQEGLRGPVSRKVHSELIQTAVGIVVSNSPPAGTSDKTTRLGATINTVDSLPKRESQNVNA